MHRYLAVLLGGLAVHQANALSVSVYYQTYNESSTNFLLNQFFPALEVLKDYIVTDLIPYGFMTPKTNKDGTLDFNHCGSKNRRMCDGNAYHACAFLHPLYASGAYDFIKCNLGNPMTGRPIDVDPIKECSPDDDYFHYLVGCAYHNYEDLRSEYLEICRKKTMELEPKLDHVPTIVFDGHYDRDLEEKAMHSFLQRACGLLTDKPPGC